MLKVEGLNVFYGGIHALADVCVEVEEGEIVTIIGANGAGKSTLLRTISGLVRSRSGSIKFRDRDITAAPSHEIVAMGIAHAPEGRRIFGNLTVRHNLRLGAFLRTRASEIERDMERVFRLFPRLKERQGQLAGTLSGGEQQMLCMGRALMAAPKLLLLDEPSMGLAPVLVQEIYREIRRIREDVTILLVEQNAYQALRVADRGYVLETGRIVMQGPCAQLRDDPVVKKAYRGG
ncbi:MAG: ABC transporter ATP-binding protein [Firmicutes bacterium]|nr:ABC transporter ATP-binding protein [Bacillota bacterium]